MTGRPEKLSERLRMAEGKKCFTPSLIKIAAQVEALESENADLKERLEDCIDSKQLDYPQWIQLQGEKYAAEKRAEKAEAEVKRVREQLEYPKLPDCLGKYGSYMDCECICADNIYCHHVTKLDSRLAKAQDAIKEKCNHCKIVVDDRLCKAVCPVPSIEKALGGESAVKGES